TVLGSKGFLDGYGLLNTAGPTNPTCQSPTFPATVIRDNVASTLTARAHAKVANRFATSRAHSCLVLEYSYQLLRAPEEVVIGGVRHERLLADIGGCGTAIGGRRATLSGSPARGRWPLPGV